MTIRNYCGLIIAILSMGFLIVSRSFHNASAPVSQQQAWGKFTAEQIIERAASVTRRFAPDIDLSSLQWATLQTTNYLPNSERVRLWKVDGNASVSSGTGELISLFFDADTGALLRFSRSEGENKGEEEGKTFPSPMSHTETLRQGWAWLRAFEKIDITPEGNSPARASANRWRVVYVKDSQPDIRAALFHFGNAPKSPNGRTVLISMNSETGNLLLLSCR